VDSLNYLCPWLSNSRVNL